MISKETNFFPFTKRFFAFSLLCLCILIALIPLNPDMPMSGLDPSWNLGMSELSATGARFGSDIVFTFGPYVDFYTKLYHPDTFGKTIIFCLACAMSTFCMVNVLDKFLGTKSTIALSISIFVAASSTDALVFTLFWIAALSAIISNEKSDGVTSHSGIIMLALSVMPFALMPMVKGTFLIGSMAVILLLILYFLFNSCFLKVGTIIVSLILTSIIFWFLSGQSIFDFPIYLSSLKPIIAGYSDAMSVGGNNFRNNSRRVIVISIFLSLGILFMYRFFFCYKGNRKSLLFILLIYAALLFLTFKAAFVRHVSGHPVTASIFLLASYIPLFATVKVSKTFTSWVVSFMIVFALLVGVRGRNIPFFPQIQAVVHVPGHFYDFMKVSLFSDNKYALRHQEAMTVIAKKAGLSEMTGSVDVLSYGQADVISTGLNWTPRPVLQSYSVYTPELSDLNRDFFLSSKGPENILMSIEPIDGRFPALEDGASWRVFLQSYDFVGRQGKYLHLARKKSRLTSHENLSVETTIKAQTSEWIKIKSTADIVFSRVRLQKNLFGQFASFLFKPSQVAITTLYENGDQKVYRFIPGMGESEFLLSPVVNNTGELQVFFERRYDALEKLTAIRFDVLGLGLGWSKNLEIEILPVYFSK